MTTGKAELISRNRSSSRTPTRPASNGSDKPLPLPAAVKAADLLPSLERLCSAKRVLNLTPHQTETWLAVLSSYEPGIVTRACLEIGLSDDPFPDLGKLTLRCETLRRRKAGAESSDGKVRIGDAMLRKIADCLNLKID